ncbi:hypothetical protein CCACVL1_11951 [Corchorus capsularis]|uniref:Uncharacterized protein n=1 Tax=Corchorus capsularis TaxID=210143 RepID=A0A1R3IIP0_COCAP|nr:hypothetical protein CCACVL1_11951 [Corchorus capsularis]
MAAPSLISAVARRMFQYPEDS